MLKHQYFALFVACLLLVMPFSSAIAQQGIVDPNYRIETPRTVIGKITCEGEYPWPDYPVYFLDVNNSSFFRESKTDENGLYVFKDILPGDSYYRWLGSTPPPAQFMYDKESLISIPAGNPNNPEPFELPLLKFGLCPFPTK